MLVKKKHLKHKIKALKEYTLFKANEGFQFLQIF